MDELDEARAGLARLEGTEKTIVKQLVEIRAAIKAQKSRIEELVKTRPPVINRIPVELLSRIFRFLLSHDNSFTSGELLELADRREILPRVSRLWRNVILDTPKFWCDVVLTYEQLLTVASMETQLRRSRKVPLNITIRDWFDGHDDIQPWIDVLASSANRWQRLHVLEVGNRILHDIFDALEGSEFPSLTDVRIEMNGQVTYPLCLLPTQAPALRNLKLLDFVPTQEFAAATTLTTLELTFSERLDPTPNPFPMLIPTQSLAVLSLTGYTTGWVLLPDSIHLPLLDALILAVDNPQQVMGAIVAPKLSHFGYSGHVSGSKHVSFGTGSKFNHVQTFNFIVTHHDIEGGDALCKEFCGVQHVGIHANTIHGLFMPKDRLSDSQPVPVDHWTSLERLTIYGLDFHLEKFDPLVLWLTKRRELGRPRPAVKLSGLSSEPMDGVGLLDLYNKLRTCTTLEVDCVELCSAVNHSTPDGLLQLDLLGVEPFVADDVFLDSFRGSVL